MELLISEGAEVLAYYDHYNWKEYAAITKNHYGKGKAVYLGCMTDQATLKAVIRDVAEVLAYYDHYNWKEYAAITKNHYGKGKAVYLGCMTDQATLKAVIRDVLQNAQVEIPVYSYPVIMRKGINQFGKNVKYFFNYSANEQSIPFVYKNGVELLSETRIETRETLDIPA